MRKKREERERMRKKGEGKRHGTKWREGRDEDIMGDGSSKKEIR